MDNKKLNGSQTKYMMGVGVKPLQHVDILHPDTMVFVLEIPW